VGQMDALGKKYDQRFKAAGEVSSRLQAEEAAFRDIQVWHSSIELG
jgi:epidermal growth factor receptor substrate 15